VLLKLQADIIAAVAPFTVETGPIGAFTAAHDDPALDPSRSASPSSTTTARSGPSSPFRFSCISSLTGSKLSSRSDAVDVGRLVVWRLLRFVKV